MKLFLRDDFARYWSGRDPFACVAKLDGEIFRAREGRRTLRFELGGREYFLKHHRGIGWGEILKNLTQFKAPVLGAHQEYCAINRLQQAGIATLTVAAFGERGVDPARRESFLITDALVDTVSLEDVFEKQLVQSPDPVFRRHLIARVAQIARDMHQAGVNHRDFYLCHFLIEARRARACDATADLHLIDLHRSQVRRQVPRRWLVKDLGGLYYSTARGRFSRTDLFRFIRTYTGRSPAGAIRAQPSLWQAVRREAERIYRRDFGAAPSFPLRYAEYRHRERQ